MSADEDGDSFPRSMRHRQVLDAAEDHPEASIEELASMVPSATPDLVEHVLDEHGDPTAEASPDAPVEQPPVETAEAESAGEGTAKTENSEAAGEDGSEGEDEEADSRSEEPTDGAGDEVSTVPDPATLSDRGRELLEAIAASPEATQGDLAERFGVTRATISRWAGEIEGLEWADRAAFVEAVLPEVPEATTDGGSRGADATQADTGGAVALAGEIAELEKRVNELEAEPVLADAELVHKVAHACLESDAISEDEELRILKGLLA